MPAPKKATPRKTTKKAVKKTAIKPAKKSVPKKVVKKSAKKATKKVVKKTTSKKSAVKSTVLEKKVPKKESAETQKPDTEDFVTLPKKASTSLKLKSVALHEVIDTLRKPMYRIAYVSAFCFMLVGITALLTDLVSIPGQQSAQICDSAGCVPGTQTSQSTTTNDSPTEGVLLSTDSPLPSPVFDLMGTIPSVLDGEAQVPFVVLNAQAVYAELLNTNSGAQFDAELEKLSPTNYKVHLVSEQLEPGSYTVKIFAIALNQDIKQFTAGVFIVEEEIPAASNVATDNSATTTQSSSTGTAQAANTSTATITSNSVTPSNNAPSTNEDQTSAEILREVTEKVEDIDEEVDLESEVVEKVEDKIPAITPFKLSALNTKLSGRQVIRATAPGTHKKIELRARSESSVDALFLGSMSKDSTGWFYAFDTKNLPNGKYEIFAVSSVNGTLKFSDSLNVQIANVVTPGVVETQIKDEVTTQTPTTEQDPKSEVVQEQVVREQFKISDEVVVPTSGPVTTVERKTIIILADNKDSLNDLMQRYGAALQTNDSIVLASIEREIEKRREELIEKALNDAEVRGIVAQLDVQLAIRVEELKARVETFESLRKSRSDDRSRSDSDGDGISDYDEETVYGTNPLVADTDGDGFIDGAEIARGFNPNDATPEAIVKYELPLDVVGLTRPDVLEVTQVEPLVVINEESEVEEVKAEIRGTGLPNSFATIYVFSSPVIVTVKTDEDGSFVYRFDKELEDGAHEVFVAFTDNTGSILAQSEPFQFVKQAQAFTPVDAAGESVVVTAPTIVESSTVNAVRFVLSLSILVLGFFLLMLGISLRRDEKEVGHVVAQ